MKNKSALKVSQWIPMVIIALSLFIGVPLFLLNYEVMSNALQYVFKVKNDSSFSGGKVAAVCYDPVGDDFGYGELLYPANNVSPGSLDLVRYTVHQPVLFSRGPGWRSYWQLDFSFRAPGTGRNIKVYFGEFDAENGSASTQVEFAENVEFTPSAPWQFVLSIRDDSGIIESYDRSFKRNLKVFSSRSGTDIYARISLADTELKFLKTLPSLNQYVLVGAFDSEGRDGFADMAESDFVPKVYDILVPDETSQEEVLSAWDEDSFLIPCMQPILIHLSDRFSIRISEKALSDETLITLRELEKSAADEKIEIDIKALELYASKPSNTLDYAIAAFDANKLAEAEDLFGALLAADKKSIPAIAYTGALIALRASSAPPLEAVGIVKDAYVWLDRAVAEAVAQEDILYASMNRGHVSLAVPNTVFGMAAHGGDDFLRAAECIRTFIKNPVGGVALTSEDLVKTVTNAARCFEIAGEISKAETSYRDARILLDTIKSESCAQERLAVFRYFEIGSLRDAESLATGKKESSKTIKNRDKEKKIQAEADLEKLIAEIIRGPAESQKIESALRLLVMEMEKIEEALRLAKSYEEKIADSQGAQLLVAVAECKMAGLVKKTIDKVDWVNTGLRRFEKIQRRWPENENVFLYQTLTYANFPSELGMIDQVLDLLEEMTDNYVSGKWNELNAPVDLLWDIWINLGAQYPKKTERSKIRERATVMSNALEIMKTSEKASEVLYE